MLPDRTDQQQDDDAGKDQTEDHHDKAAHQTPAPAAHSVAESARMKILIFGLAAICSSTLAAAAQLDRGEVNISKVESSVVKTPEYQIAGGPTKRYDVGDWLEVEVEFETTPQIIPELTLKYVVLIAGKLVQGHVTHVNIAHGRDHYSVMYIEPRALRRLSGGNFVGVNTAEAVWIEAVRGGRTVATYPSPPKLLPKLPRITGVMRNKEQTPFAPLYYDRYEAIKL